jgi:putrescine transport system ATP-binding protein
LTFLIVTHDQEEAMTVSDRIAVMDKGEIVQVATPAEIYEAPNCRYVADFIGDINIVEGLLMRKGQQSVVINSDISAVVDQPCTLDDGTSVAFAIRPEKVRISIDPPADTSANAVYGEVWDIAYLGDFSVFIIKRKDGSMFRAAQANVSRLVDRPITFCDMVWLSWTADAGLLLTR